MLFECVDEVGHPVERVFHLIRDDMPGLLPYLNDVEEIVVIEREDQEGGKVRIVNLWRGSNTKAPKVVQKFLSRDMLSWTDYALWHSDEPRHAEWRLEPKVGASVFECSGKTTVTESTPGKCQIKIQGDLRIYPDRVPGVPKFLAGRLRGKIEAFVVGMIVPNMQTMARGVQAYFDDMDSGELPALPE